MPITLYGTEAQKQKYVPKLASGEWLVEYDSEKPNGITLGEEEHKLGIRASSTRQVFFNDTEVPHCYASSSRKHASRSRTQRC